jgi:hypothetical protein
MDGDGRPEMPIMTHLFDTEDTLQVFDTVSHELVWSYKVPDRSYFDGFVDIDGDGANEAIFSCSTTPMSVRLVDWRTNSTIATIGDGSDRYIGAIADFDGDEKMELLIAIGLDYPLAYELWGDGTGQVAVPSDNNTSKLTPTLVQNAPNPFSTTTKLSVTIPVASRTIISIYDVEGRLVRRLADANFSAGVHLFSWDGKSDNGRRMPSSTYYCQVRTDGKTLVKESVILR